jgi:hypothetical protein
MALDGEQRGPFDRRTLVDKLMPLSKDADVHVWNEDLDGWKPPHDLPEIAREIAARRKAPPPPPRVRPTPPPLPPMGAPRARTQPLPVTASAGVSVPLGAGGPRLPPPSVPDLQRVHAPIEPPSGWHEPSPLFESAGVVHAPPAPTNGVASNGSEQRGGAPALPLGNAESDALNALNIGAAARAMPLGDSMRNGAAPRLVSASSLAAWDAPATLPQAGQGRHRNAKFFLGLFAVVGVVVFLLLFNVMKKASPASAPAVARAASGEDPFASLADKVAMEKPGPPPPVPAPPPPEAPKASPTKVRFGGRAGRNVAGHTAPPLAAAAPAAGEDPSAARFRETGGRAIQVPTNSSSGRGTPGQGDITRVINNNKNGIKTCYQRALLRDSSLTHGKLTVRVSIGLSGRVKNVGVDGPMQFRTLEPCIREVVSRWMFPPSSEEYGTEFVSSFQGNE